MRKLKELIELPPGAPVSPAEQAMLNAHFMTPKKERGAIGTLVLAGKGKLMATAEDIRALADKEEKREAAEKELTQQIKELGEQLRKQHGK